MRIKQTPKDCEGQFEGLVLWREFSSFFFLDVPVCITLDQWYRAFKALSSVMFLHHFRIKIQCKKSHDFRAMFWRRTTTRTKRREREAQLGNQHTTHYTHTHTHTQTHTHTHTHTHMMFMFFSMWCSNLGRWHGSLSQDPMRWFTASRPVGSHHFGLRQWPYCFASTETRLLIRDGGWGGGGGERRGRESEGSTADTARKRPKRPWTAVRTMKC